MKIEVETYLGKGLGRLNFVTFDADYQIYCMWRVRWRMGRYFTNSLLGDLWGSDATNYSFPEGYSIIKYECKY